ncbi:MAG: NADH-quinone oxidoreductase subunit H [Elusimicrobia bacterium]|nr:NADH-quinone oxidoreductase subunit H [Elusimicrobiota bacterium]
MICCELSPRFWTDSVWSGFKILLALGFGMNVAALMSWVERKQSAVIQDRIGANRADILGFRFLGLFHILSDAIKMLTKEDFEPPAGIRPWHALAPIVSMACAALCLAALPFGDVIEFAGRTWSLVPIQLDYSVLYVLALLSIGVHGVVMAGWSSGSNYALLGGLRGAAQMISYEVAMLAILAGPLFLYGTLDLAQASRWQAHMIGGVLPAWGIFLQPLAFILFMTAGAAETKRAPFDLPEGEAEIVGYFVEYSGMKFGMFLTTDFLESIVLAGMATALFLGGWHVPGLSHLGLPQAVFALVGVAAFTTKLLAVLWLLMQIRWTLPRFRFDQLLDLGWKNVLPLALANLLVTAWAVTLLS